MTYIYFVYSILFIFGNIVGSFLNVVAVRYNPNRFLLDKDVLGGRSHCPVCKRQLLWYELIPLASFFIQRGRCRHCGHRISLQYPFVELASGLIFLAVPLFFNTLYRVNQLAFAGQDIRWFYGLSVVWILAFLSLLLLSIIDFKQLIIPNELNVFLAFLGVGAVIFKRDSFLGFYATLFQIDSGVWLDHIFGAFVVLIFFGSVIFLSRGKGMGLGDLKLAAALGFLFGWPDIIVISMLAFVLGSIVSVALMLINRKSLHDSVPFGPFLALSSFIVFFFGFDLLGGYFALFGA